MKTKTLYALLAAIAFALLSVMLAYYTKGLWSYTMSSTSDKANIPLVSTLIAIQYCLVAGFVLSLAAFEKEGFENLANILSGGLLDGLIVGLVLGLVWGITTWMVFGSVTWLISGLVIWLVVGSVTGLINE